MSNQADLAIVWTVAKLVVDAAEAVGDGWGTTGIGRQRPCAGSGIGGGAVHSPGAKARHPKHPGKAATPLGSVAIVPNGPRPPSPERETRLGSRPRRWDIFHCVLA
jgi:hypothetical protein